MSREGYPAILVWTREMNRRALLWPIAIVLLATVGCSPRHPPHTPKPFGMNAATGGPVLSINAEDADMRYIEFGVPEVAETRDLDENTRLDLDKDDNICAMTIAIEHA